MLDPALDREAPTFDDPVGVLRACHERIERQLATLGRLVRHIPIHGADDAARAAARRLLRYFDVAAPNHHADEEASVFPRLLMRSAEPQALLAALHADHDHLDEQWRRLRPLIAGIACGQRANLPPAMAHAFESLYTAHLAQEDEDLLPRCSERLTHGDLAAIGLEMAARRGVAWPPA